VLQSNKNASQVLISNIVAKYDDVFIFSIQPLDLNRLLHRISEFRHSQIQKKALTQVEVKTQPNPTIQNISPFFII